MDDATHGMHELSIVGVQWSSISQCCAPDLPPNDALHQLMPELPLQSPFPRQLAVPAPPCLGVILRFRHGSLEGECSLHVCSFEITCKLATSAAASPTRLSLDTTEGRVNTSIANITFCDAHRHELVFIEM